MNKCLIIYLILLLSNNIFAQKSAPDPISFKEEIRTILCEIEADNYVNAQSNLEKILQKEPRNILANRLLPIVLSHQIPIENSPEGIAQTRKTIEAYEKSSKLLQVSGKERRNVNDYISRLYFRISREEELAFLQKKAEDTSLLPEERSSYYSILATAFYSCAVNISLKSVKTIAGKDGKQIEVFTRPKSPTEFNKLKTCVAKGLEMIDKAIAIEKSSGKETESVWVYKARLLSEKMQIAEMEGNLPAKRRLQKEVVAAKKRLFEIGEKRAEKKPEPAKSSAFEFLQSGRTEELAAYKMKPALEKQIPAIDVPGKTTYVVPEPSAPSKPGEPSNKNEETAEKTNLPPGVWKVDSLDGELITEMPRDVRSYSQREIKIHEGEDGQIKFLVVSQPKLSSQTRETEEKVLNSLAWSMAESIGNSLINDKRIEEFEIKFAKKATVSGRTAYIYSYKVRTCQGETDSVLIVLAGNSYNYAVDVRGLMNVNEPRAEGFIESLRIK